MEHDILAFGQDLIAARPKLCRAAQNLAGRDAGRLVTRIMDDAWRARDQFQPDQEHEEHHAELAQDFEISQLRLGEQRVHPFAVMKQPQDRRT